MLDRTLVSKTGGAGSIPAGATKAMCFSFASIRSIFVLKIYVDTRRSIDTIQSAY